MVYSVWRGNYLVYEGESWPMARAALDVLMLTYDGKECPQLTITQKPEP